MGLWQGRVVRRVLWSVCLVACGGKTQFTPVGAPQPPRGENCDFQIFTSPPTGGYTELGTVDVQLGGYGSNARTDLTTFKQQIQPYVCSGGGDAAIAYANGAGIYIKATVIRAVAPAPAAPSAQAKAPGAEEAAAAAAAAPGCRYDTQCKGDRICVKGDCVEAPITSGPASGGTTAGPPAP